MHDQLLLILIAGFGGGIVRGLTGFVKHQYSYKNVKFNLPYFLLMMFLSGLIGLLTAAVVDGQPALAFVAGYAGGDFIENLYKIAKGKTSLWEEVLN